MHQEAITVKCELDENALSEDILRHLENIYPGQYAGVHHRLLTLIQKYYPSRNTVHHELWSQHDILLITYGNSILETDTLPLDSLHKFLNQYLHDSINCVHILPFFPYSSDDGFSVID